MKLGQKILTPWAVIRALVIGLAVLLLLGPTSSRAEPHASGMLVTPVYPTSGLEATVANHPPVAMPYFEWQPVAGARSYRLQVSDQIGFNTVQRDVIIPHTKYLATDVGWLRDTTWYWRVKVQESPNGERTWVGLLPCSDCQGIDTRLVLRSRGGQRDYLLTETYIGGRGKNTFSREGAWKEVIRTGDGQPLTLFVLDPDQAGQRFSLQPDGALELLEGNGERSGQAVAYRLQRL